MLTHEANWILFINKRIVKAEPNHTKDEWINVLNSWRINYWSDHEEHGHKQCDYWDDHGHLQFHQIRNPPSAELSQPEPEAIE